MSTVISKTILISSGVSSSGLLVGANGEADVQNGGILTDSIVSTYSGIIYVDEGGFIQRVSAFDGGEICVDGSAVDLTAENLAMIDIFPGGELNGGTFLNGGRGIVYESATATNVAVSSGGTFLLYGGTANETRIDGGTMTVSNGGTANKATISSGGTMIIKSGGSVNSANIHTDPSDPHDEAGFDRILVSSGGTATNINASGLAGIGFDVAPDTYVQGTCNGSSFEMKNAYISGYSIRGGAWVTVCSGGSADGMVLLSGSLELSSGGVMNNTFLGDAEDINGWGYFEVFSGGVANDTVVNGNYYLEGDSGAVLNDITLQGNGACFTISSGCTGNNTTIFDGQMYIPDGGVANNVTVDIAQEFDDDGEFRGIHLLTGGRLTGRLTFLNGAAVSAETGAILDFDLTQTAPGADALLNDLSKIDGLPSYTLTVSGTEADGTYLLAGGAAGFDETITVLSALGNELGTLSVGNTLAVGETDYSLDLADGVLTLTVSQSGSTYAGLTLSDGDYFFIQDGETGRDITVNYGGHLYIGNNGRANDTIVNSGGSMFVSSGGTTNNTTVNSRGHFTVVSGGTANSTTVVSVGWMYVSNGGTANSTSVNSGALIVFSGGTANNNSVRNDGVVYVSSGGTANDTTVNANGYFDVYSGGTANSTTVNAEGSFEVRSDGTANGTTVNSGGGFIIQDSGGTANSTTVNAGGFFTIYSGTANDTTVNSNGYFTVVSGGTANDITVNSGGSFHITAGGKLTGKTTVETGANVVLENAAILDFDISGTAPGAEALVNDLSVFTIGNNASITITVSDDQPYGVYSLADGAGDFYRDVILQTTSATIGDLMFGCVCQCDGVDYTLVLDENNGLKLIKDLYIPPAPEFPDLAYVNSEWGELADGMIITIGNKTAIIGYDAFAALTPAIMSVTDDGSIEVVGGEISFADGYSKTITVDADATVVGKATFANPITINGTIAFDIANATAEAAQFDGFSNVAGDATYTLTAAYPVAGLYLLASDVTAFTSTVAFGDVTLAVAEAVVVGDFEYALGLADGILFLSVCDFIPPAPEIPDLAYVNSEWTGLEYGTVVTVGDYYTAIIGYDAFAALTPAIEAVMYDGSIEVVGGEISFADGYSKTITVDAGATVVGKAAFAAPITIIGTIAFDTAYASATEAQFTGFSNVAGDATYTLTAAAVAGTYLLASDVAAFSGEVVFGDLVLSVGAEAVLVGDFTYALGITENNELALIIDQCEPPTPTYDLVYVNSEWTGLEYGTIVEFGDYYTAIIGWDAFASGDLGIANVTADGMVEVVGGEVSFTNTTAKAITIDAGATLVGKNTFGAAITINGTIAFDTAFATAVTAQFTGFSNVVGCATYTLTAAAVAGTYLLASDVTEFTSAVAFGDVVLVVGAEAVTVGDYRYAIDLYEDKLILTITEYAPPPPPAPLPQAYVNSEWEGLANGTVVTVGDYYTAIIGWDAFASGDLGIANVTADGMVEVVGGEVSFTNTTAKAITVDAGATVVGKATFGADITVNGTIAFDTAYASATEAQFGGFSFVSGDTTYTLTAAAVEGSYLLASDLTAPFTSTIAFGDYSLRVGDGALVIGDYSYQLGYTDNNELDLLIECCAPPMPTWPSKTYVNSAWASLPDGTRVTIGNNTATIGYDAFASLELAIWSVDENGSVEIVGGTVSFPDGCYRTVVVDAGATIVGRASFDAPITVSGTIVFDTAYATVTEAQFTDFCNVSGYATYTLNVANPAVGTYLLASDLAAPFTSRVSFRGYSLAVGYAATVIGNNTYQLLYTDDNELALQIGKYEPTPKKVYVNTAWESLSSGTTVYISEEITGTIGYNAFSDGDRANEKLTSGGDIILLGGKTEFTNPPIISIDHPSYRIIHVSSGATLAGDCATITRVHSGGSVSSATINESWFDVYSGGMVEQFIINAGELYVNDGGSANHITVNAGGFLWIESGGTVLNIVENGGNVWIDGNASASFAANTFDGLYLGDEENATVHSGTTAQRTTVEGGHLRVYSGGVANKTEVRGDEGSIRIESGGTASGITVRDGGFVKVYSGGTALDIDWTPFAGRLAIDDDTNVTFTSRYSGVYYGADGQMFSSAAVITSETIGVEDYWYDSEEMFVMSGGTANSIKVNYEYATLHIWSGGTANDTKVQDGYVFVSSGGTAYNTMVNNGAEDEGDGYIHSNGGLFVRNGGTASKTTLLGEGLLKVFSGGTAIGTMLQKQSYMMVSSGGTATGITVRNGSLLVSSGGTATDIEWTPGSGSVAFADGAYVTFAGQHSGVYYKPGEDALYCSDTTWTAQGNEKESMYVMSGGILNNGAATEECHITVFSGGTANNVVVSTDGVLRVHSGGTAANVVWTPFEGEVSAYEGADITFAGRYSGVYLGGYGSLLFHSGTMNSAKVLGDYDEWEGNGSGQRSGDEMYVMSGGVANDTEVGGVYVRGGKLHVWSGGTANRTSVFGADMVVSSGGTANDNVLHGRSYEDDEDGYYMFSAGQLKVQGGVANRTTIDDGGSLEVRSKGTATSTTVNNGGSFRVFSMGTAYKTVVNSGGNLSVSGGGLASDVLTASSGFVTILSGGTATGVTVSRGATLTVSSGGSAVDVTWNPFEGTISIEAGAYITFVNPISGVYYGSGTELLSHAKVINSQTVARASMFVMSGGTANGTEVTSSGIVLVSSGGTANGATVGLDGELTVGSGGTANDIVVSDGTLVVNSGGTAFNAIVNAGLGEGGIVVSGGGTATIAFNPWQGDVIADEAAVVTYLGRDAKVYFGGPNDGLLSKADVMESLDIRKTQSAIVFSGGKVDSTNVRVGSLIVSGGGTASNTNVQDSLYIFGGTATGVTVDSGSVFVYDKGQVNRVTMDGGSLHVSSGGTANNIAVNEGVATVFDNGTASRVLLTNEGQLDVSSGGMVNSVTLDAGGILTVFEGGSAIRTKVKGNENCDGVMDVLSDGRADETAVDAGGSLTLYDGGVASSTTVKGSHDGYGCLFVSSGGTATGVTVDLGGSLDVLCEGTAFQIRENGGAVEFENGAVVEFVSNTFSGTILRGTVATVHSRTTASNVVVSAGEGLANGNLVVYSGGTANGTFVKDWGALVISSGGRAVNVTGDGLIEVGSGGVLTGKIRLADEGGISVDKGGTVNFDLSSITPDDPARINNLSLVSPSPGNKGQSVRYTLTLDEGQEDGYYTLAKGAEGFDRSITVTNTEGDEFDDLFLDETTTINGLVLKMFLRDDALILQVGGFPPEPSETILNNSVPDAGETLSIQDGLIANDADINSGAVLVLSGNGVANEAMVNSEGRLRILKGGIANSTFVNDSGWGFVSSGGKARDTMIYGGFMYVYQDASAERTAVFGDGTLFVSMGGTATSTTVNQYGSLTVFNGGTASGANIASGGWLNVSSGGTVVNFVAERGANLNFSVVPDTYIRGTSDGVAFELKNGSVSGYTINGGNITVSSGGTVNGITVNGTDFDLDYIIDFDEKARGYLTVSRGGTANDITVNRYGCMVVRNGGTANNVDLANGGTAEVHSGGTANNVARINDDSDMLTGLYVFSGGTATIAFDPWLDMEFVTSDEGAVVTWLDWKDRDANVFFGGEEIGLVSRANVMSSLKIESGYSALVYSGGTVKNTDLLGGDLIVSSGGTAISTIGAVGKDEYDDDVFGRIEVRSGGTATGIDVTSLCRLELAVASGTYIQGTCGGSAFEMKNASISGYSVIDGELTVFSGAVANDTTVSECGNLSVLAGGTANNITIHSDGGLFVASGGKITGHLTFEDVWTNVYLETGAILDFDLTQATAGTDALVNDISTMLDGPTYTLTVNGAHYSGTYNLAEGADGFDRTISVVSETGIALGTLSVGETIQYGSNKYTLNLDESSLTLRVKGENDTDQVPPTVSGITPSTTAPTNGNVTVTAVFKDDVALASSLYRIGENGAWTAYANSVTVEKNATIYFKAVDTSGNESDVASITIDNIDKVKPVISITPSTTDLAESVTVTANFSDNVAVASKLYRIGEDGAWTAYGNGAVVNENTTVYFKATDTAGNEAEDSYIVTNIRPASNNVVSGLIVSDGESVVVSANRIYKDTRLLGGRMFVLSGGTAINTVTEFADNDEYAYWGTIYVCSGGIADGGTLTGGLEIAKGGVASGFIHSGGWIEVFGGGTLTDITVGGWADVYSGGTADLVTIESGGTLYVEPGGTATNIVWTPCEGNIFISSGAVATFASRYSGVYFGSGGHLVSSAMVMNSKTLTGYDGYDDEDSHRDEMYVMSGGTANSTTVSLEGNLFVMSGGTADNTVVSGGCGLFGLRVSGGIAKNTFVDSEGAFLVAAGGTASDTIVAEGGSFTVSGGGSADNIFISGGTLTVSSGGTATNINWTPCEGYVSVADGAYVTYSGSYSGVYLGSGGQLISHSAVMIRKQLDELGEMNVMSGGTAIQTDVYGGGSMIVWSGGTANGVTVDREGSLQICSGGTATNVEALTGASVIIDVAPNTYVDGIYESEEDYGLLEMKDGIISGFTVYSCGLNICSGGTATDITVGSDRFHVASGGVANNVRIGGLDSDSYDLNYPLMINAYGDMNNVVIESGGWLFACSGATLNSVTLHSGSLDIESGGRVNDLFVSGGGSVDVEWGSVVSNVTVDVTEQTDPEDDDWYGRGRAIGLDCDAKLTGRITILNGTISAYSIGAILDFDLTQTTAGDAALVNDLSKIEGMLVYTLTVDGTQESGEYRLADGASAFDGTIAVVNTDGTELGTLKTGRKATFDGTDYTLNLANGRLTVTVEAAEIVPVDTTAPTVSNIRVNTTAPTNQDVTVTATFSDDVALASALYRIGEDGAWTDYAGGVTVSANTTVYFKAVDAAGNQSMIVSYKVTNIDKVPPAKPTTKADVTAPTTGSVNVTATFSDDSVTREYSLDSGNTWKEYTSAVEFVSNGMVLFRGTDAAGNISEVAKYSVTNIESVVPDTTAPTISNVAADITAPTNRDVTVTAVFADDVALASALYRIGENGAWTDYEGGVTVSENTTVYFKAVDTSGNESAVASITVANIDKVPPAKPTAAADVTAPTTGKVNVTATFSGDSVRQEYSLDNGNTWKEYTSAVGFVSNGTVFFRGTDAAGNISETASYSVTNIETSSPDTIAPTVSNVTADITVPTNLDVTVTAVFADDVALASSLYRIGENGAWTDYAGGVTVSENTTVYFKAVDAAGNESAVASYTVSNIDKVPPAKPTATADVTTTTKGSVNVSAAFSDDSVVKEYSLDGKTWTAYTGPVKFEKNGSVFFRAADAVGNMSDVATWTVNNIVMNGQDDKNNKLIGDDGKPNPAIVESEGTAVKQGVDSIQLDDSMRFEDEDGELYDNFVGQGDEFDYAKITLEKAAKLSFEIDATDAVKFSIFTLNEKTGKKTTLKSLQATTLKNGGSGTVTKQILLEAGDYYISMQSTNAKKGGSAFYNVGLNESGSFASHFFTDGDNGDNNWLYDSKKKAWNTKVTKSEALAIDSSFLNKGSSAIQIDTDEETVVSHKTGNTTYTNFVGFGDPMDVRKIELASAAKLSFDVSLTGGTGKFFVYYEDTKGKMATVGDLTTTFKASGTTKKAAVLNAGTYYIAFQSSNAKKGDEVYYNVKLNSKSEFYTDGDSTANDFDSKAKTVSAEARNKFANLETGKALQIDGVLDTDAGLVIDHDGKTNFVGTGDVSDVLRIRAAAGDSLSLKITATDSVKLVVYGLQSNGKLKALKTVKAKEGEGILDYTFKAKDGSRFFVGVEAVNAKKGSAAWYNVDVLSFSGSSSDTLAMPETDSLAMTDSLSFGQYGTDALADVSAASLAELDDKSAWENIASLA